MERVLITGGAGFIGSHTADLLLTKGFQVRVLDALIPQVHPSGRPSYLSPEVELIVADVRNSDAVSKALDGVSYVYHFAAETGVGQSMHELERYFSTNVVGTAVLWEQIQKSGPQVKKVILSSSRAVYGEGMYHCSKCGIVYPQRSKRQLMAHQWYPRCSSCGGVVEILPTSENATPHPVSVYGLTKKMQEDICVLMGKALGIPVVILRYFNVYGPRQSLSNPYTGIVVNFLLRAKVGKPLLLYEEGLPVRDFVHVSDVVQANFLALVTNTSPIEVFNIGTGVGTSIADLAHMIFQVLRKPEKIKYTTRFRVGDIFGCYANIEHAFQKLNYRPTIGLTNGLSTVLSDLIYDFSEDSLDHVEEELRKWGLLQE
jgi:dTDP-L-rhamnose 4-epimerase